MIIVYWAPPKKKNPIIKAPTFKAVTRSPPNAQERIRASLVVQCSFRVLVPRAAQGGEQPLLRALKP